MTELPNFLLEFVNGGRVIPRIVERPIVHYVAYLPAYETTKMAIAPIIISSVPRTIRASPASGMAKGHARSASNPRNVSPTASTGSRSRQSSIAIKSQRSFSTANSNSPT